MLKKSFTNEDLGIEINSYIDNKQNVWFRGKDVANILGYKNTDDAIRRHVSTENKMIHLLHSNCCPRETQGQQNGNRGKCCPCETQGQQNGTRGKCCPVKHRVNKITPRALKQGVNKMM